MSDVGKNQKDTNLNKVRYFLCVFPNYAMKVDPKIIIWRAYIYNYMFASERDVELGSIFHIMKIMPSLLCMILV